MKTQPRKLLPCSIGQNDPRVIEIRQEEKWVISLIEIRKDFAVIVAHLC